MDYCFPYSDFKSRDLNLTNENDVLKTENRSSLTGSLLSEHLSYHLLFNFSFTHPTVVPALILSFSFHCATQMSTKDYGSLFLPQNKNF